MRSRSLVVGVMMVASGCSQHAGHDVTPIASPVQLAPGACAGTIVLTSVPPPWARAGFSISGGEQWVPWAMSRPPGALAYLFAIQLVAQGARPDHRSNKVLWVTHSYPNDLKIRGHPYGHASPSIDVSGQVANGNQLPSIVDVPTSGCWSFDLTWGLGGERQTGTISLDVLPPGTAPAPATTVSAGRSG